MSYTVGELENALDTFDVDEPYIYKDIFTGAFVSRVRHRDSWEGVRDFFRSDETKSFELSGIGTVRLAELEGGYEGHGEDIYFVLSVTDSTGVVRFFRKNGYYESYDGEDWDGSFFEVRPREVRRTEYWRL